MQRTFASGQKSFYDYVDSEHDYGKRRADLDDKGRLPPRRRHPVQGACVRIRTERGNRAQPDKPTHKGSPRAQKGAERASRPSQGKKKQRAPSGRRRISNKDNALLGHEHKPDCAFRWSFPQHNKKMPESMRRIFFYHPALYEPVIPRFDFFCHSCTCCGNPCIRLPCHGLDNEIHNSLYTLYSFPVATLQFDCSTDFAL